MPVVALITDLFFVTKVKGTADALGVALIVGRSAADLVSAAKAGARLAIVDMNAAGADAVEAIRACKAAAPDCFVVAYLSHVQRELGEAAKAAGADLVMPRSKFSQDLPGLLQRHAGGGQG
jgi:DNA-binding NarL/FixJ family response regulator